MAYATKADIAPSRMTLQDLAELTSEDGTIDDDVVQAKLEEATGVVNAYCSQRYKTPMQPSDLVKKITLDLTVYFLFARRRETKITETVSEARDMAMSFLRDVSTGKASLDQPITAEQPQTSTSDVTVTQQRQVFDDTNLRGFC